MFAGAPPFSTIKKISTATPAAVAALDFTLDAAYDAFWLKGYLIPATDDVQLWLRLDSNGGASFDAGASDYGYASDGRYGAVNAGPVGLTGDTKIILTPDPGAGFGVGNAAAEGVEFWIEIARAANAALFTMVKAWGTIACADASVSKGWWFTSGARNAAQADNAVRLLCESGNIASGRVALIGVKY